jgi:hypothetical protein
MQKLPRVTASGRAGVYRLGPVGYGLGFSVREWPDSGINGFGDDARPFGIVVRADDAQQLRRYVLAAGIGAVEADGLAWAGEQVTAIGC